ncbi:MAG TPA: hypothetical protein VNY53_00520, partial [Bradyrhizobium sp.]|nr:hypothetical protein [Bradyrhizobium sp.]
VPAAVVHQTMNLVKAGEPNNRALPGLYSARLAVRATSSHATNPHATEDIKTASDVLLIAPMATPAANAAFGVAEIFPE